MPPNWLAGNEAGHVNEIFIKWLPKFQLFNVKFDTFLNMCKKSHLLNRLSFYITMLRFSLLHPQRGFQIFQTAQQVREDSLHKHDYSATHDRLEDVIDSLFPEDSEKLEGLKNETRQIQAQLKAFFTEISTEKFPSRKKPYPTEYSLNDFSGMFLYALCRLFKPEIIVETGVAYGNSSSFILKALKENKKGQLYSIDYVFRPWENKEAIGSAIPTELRDRWNLVFGPTSKKLKKTMEDLGQIDIFFHDSLHTYKNMMFEFDAAWPHVRKGGFLLSDDINDNSAFYQFYSSLKINPIIIGKTKQSFFGVLQKPD